MNLPKKITFGTQGTMTYLYDATGQKLKKTMTEGTNLQNTEYLDGFQYTQEALDFFPHQEGYVKVVSAQGVGGSSSFNYVFTYTDHLGNIRLRYTKTETQGLAILEEDHYYPFGLKHNGYNSDHKIFEFNDGTNTVVLTPVTPSRKETYKYKFGGMELQEEFGTVFYDFGARNYDPALGRWINIDPLADHPKQFGFSPYTYAANNPIFFIDPDGRLFDDYGLDEATGNISLIKKTDDDTDTLYAGSGEGESFVKDESKGSVTVNQHADGSSVISDLSVDNAKVETVANGQDSTKERTSNITHTNNADDAFNIFKFVADNSNVEWSLHKFTIDNGSSFLYQIGTYHDGFESPRFDNQGIGTWLGGIHSHPRTRGNAADRRESLDGDLSVGRSYLRKYGGNLPYLTYFPSTGKASRIGLSNDPLRPDGVTIKNEISNYRF